MVLHVTVQDTDVNVDADEDEVEAHGTASDRKYMTIFKLHYQQTADIKIYKQSSSCRLQMFGPPFLLQMSADVICRLQTFSYRKNKQHLSPFDLKFVNEMSEVFEGYERQYCELSAGLSKKCTSASLLDGEQKKQKLSEIKAGLDEAESLIRKMDLEARSLQPNLKAVLLARLREYKSDLNNLKSEVKRISSTNLNQAARDELLESGMADAATVSADQKARLLMSTERLNKTSDRVREGRRTMLETEELGVSILQDLNQQRQSLLHAHGTLHGVDDNIGRSKKILTNMSRRMSRNKWIIGSIVAVLILAIILILYFKLK
ncbi:hypothetical protein QVD17_24636 [Tagetes erecta]|uniref:Vesicle transport v-SNARE N-terminal domain-containing protein n=1 Tax=Tagetes erecta TaxID=13708 RepID=A0AAD8KIA5_TARER|nr:hypothetical protein QVD17_24636 [Tagetes erecta]